MEILADCSWEEPGLYDIHCMHGEYGIGFETCLLCVHKWLPPTCMGHAMYCGDMHPLGFSCLQLQLIIGSIVPFMVMQAWQ